MTENKHLRICYDRIIPEGDLINSDNIRGVIDLSKLNNSTKSSERLAIAEKKMWSKETIICRFLDGTSYMREKVINLSNMWTKHCKINFIFSDGTNEDIRIAFKKGMGSWSAVGTDALIEKYFPKEEPTMNLGWLDENTQEDEWSRVVLHEFGHALGCVHEHSTPCFERDWNVEKVYDIFSRPPNNWSREEIEFNILYKYPKNELLATSYDPQSIMLYMFDGELFSDKKGPTNNNTALSSKDIEMINRLYS